MRLNSVIVSDPSSSDVILPGPGAAEAVPRADATAAPRPGWGRRLWHGAWTLCNWCFGAVTIVVGLAVLSILPVLNLLSLGYLLEASGRVARTGRLRDGFIGMRQASIMGSMVLGTWLVFWPVRLVSSLWQDASLVAPGSRSETFWHAAVAVLAVLTVGHVAWACIRGGRFRHFLWPAPVRFVRWLSEEGKYAAMRDAVWRYVTGLRLPYYFWMGVRGFFGALLWLLAPVAILMGASNLPPDKGGVFFSLVGSLILLCVVVYLPFLQAHFAMTNRFREMFSIRAVRHLFRRAPIAFWMAMVVTVLFALPLYFLKIELTPQELAWLPSLFFVAFIFPARLLTGWAVSRGHRRQTKRHLLFRWLGRAGLIPMVGLYVLFVYLSQYLSWNGAASLLEQHAFMVPAPLMNL